MTSSAPAAPRLAGLDGLRAIAVALVLAYHLFPDSVFVGGFAGVDVFFVLSGFLITTLLLRERERTGRIALGGFWRRRARRLLPALAVVVTVCASLAWLIGGDVLTGMGLQILGAATFSYNWLSLADGGGYFAAGAPELFRNLWSLAVEEQFYVIWPLVLPLLLLLPWRSARAAVAAIAALGSAWWMGVLVASPASATRAYFGTDSHAFGILLGVSLAFVLAPALSAPASWMSRRAPRALGLIVGAAALAGIAVVAGLPATDSAATFPGSLLAVSALTLVTIAASTWPGSWFGRTLDVAPLRWVGDRSYALYLWHWPILVLLTTATSGSVSEVPLATGAGALVLTVVAAEISGRAVEQPIRRHGFRGAWRRWTASLAAGPGRRLAGIAALVAAVLALGGTTAAIAGAPAQTSAESAVQAGIAALEDQAESAPADTPAPSAAQPAPVPTPVAGDEITAIGDSVMLASAPALMARYPGIQVDATVSRSMYAAPGILEQLAATGQLRRFVVIALGTNGPIERDTLERITGIVGPDRELVLVTAHAPRDWIAGVNTALQDFSRRPGVELADWSAAISAREDLLAGDRIHPGSSGGEVFAQTVAGAVDAAETERTEREFRREQRESGRNHLPQPR